jgi:hypothetical protein
MPDYLEKLLKAILANGWAKTLPGKTVNSQVYISLESVADVATAGRKLSQDVA